MNPHRLLQLVDSEWKRERRALLARAEEEAGSILEEARAEAERILARELPVPSSPAADLGLAATKAEFLTRYQAKLEEVRGAARRELSRLEDEDGRQLLAAVLTEILMNLGPGAYRLEAPEDFWSYLGQRQDLPRGRALRWSGSSGHEVVLRSEDGSLRVRLSLEGMLERYFEREAAHVARLLLGDGFC